MDSSQPLTRSQVLAPAALGVIYNVATLLSAVLPMAISERRPVFLPVVAVCVISLIAGALTLIIRGGTRLLPDRSRWIVAAVALLLLIPETVGIGEPNALFGLIPLGALLLLPMLLLSRLVPSGAFLLKSEDAN